MFMANIIVKKKKKIDGYISPILKNEKILNNFAYQLSASFVRKLHSIPGV